MLFGFLMVLFLVAILLLVFRRQRGGLGVLAVAVALLWAAGSGGLAGRLLKPLQEPRGGDPAWGARNAVVLLGAGMVKPGGSAAPQPSLLAYSRILEAVRLYRGCRASGKPCALIISGGDPLRLGGTEAAVYRGEALGLGVPDGDVILEPRSLNTFQNAQFCGEILRAGGYDQVVLVTSALHMKRSQLYFSHFGIRCQGVPSDYMGPTGSWLPLGYNFALTEFAIHEHVGLLRYRLYNAMGWNPKVAGKAGAA